MKRKVYRWLYAISVVSGSLACGHASAMQNEPRDFKGVPWGAPLEDHKQSLSQISGDDVSAHYQRAADAKTFANVDAWRISYRFYKNRFSSATVTIVGTSNFDSMMNYLTKNYGQPEAVSPRHRIYRWEGELSGIMTSCDISMSCYIEFYGTQMRELEVAEQGEVPSRIKQDN